MWKKIKIQTILCLLIALGIFASMNCGINMVKNKVDSVLKYMETDFETEDVKRAGKKCLDVISYFPVHASKAIDVISGKPTYGEPIDEVFNGDVAMVYAVGGGKVTAVGENEEIGRYVRIDHGGRAESLYGNMKKINVVTPENVKKGQIIGIYEKKDGKDFYFSLKERD